MAQGVYPTRTPRVNVGALVLEAWREIDMQQKEAALIAEWDESTLSKALQQKAAMDLWKMVEWPLRFWQMFLPLLAKALITSWWNGRVDLEMAKAGLREDRANSGAVSERKRSA